MANLPSVVKTWQFDENVLVGAGSETDTNRTQMLAMKDAMVGFATSGWTVIGSSDSVASGMDATDRWSVIGDVVAGDPGNAHSWIVLEQPGIQFAGKTNPLQLLMTMNGAVSGPNHIARSFVISVGDGFGTANGGTDGSTTTDPTATDQWAPQWRSTFISGGTHGAARQTVMQSTDGKITRVIIGDTNVGERWWSIETPIMPAGLTWATPVVFMSKGGGDFAAVNQWNNTVNDIGGANTGVRFVTDVPGVAGLGTLDPAGYARQGLARLATTYKGAVEWVRDPSGEIVHAVGGGFGMSPAVVWSEDGGLQGDWGELVDFQFIGETTNPQDSLPSGGQKTWWCLGDIIIPGLNDSATDIDL